MRKQGLLTWALILVCLMSLTMFLACSKEAFKETPGVPQLKGLGSEEMEAERVEAPDAVSMVAQAEEGKDSEAAAAEAEARLLSDEEAAKQAELEAQRKAEEEAARAAEMEAQRLAEEERQAALREKALAEQAERERIARESAESAREAERMAREAERMAQEAEEMAVKEEPAGGDTMMMARAETEAAAEGEASKAAQAEPEKVPETVRTGIEDEKVYFDFDSSALTETAKSVLQRKAEFLKERAETDVLIEGHCDERGSVEYNLALGQRRAESVKRYLVLLGISSERLRTISYGKERPADPRHTEEAWAKNRRAEFVID